MDKYIIFFYDYVERFDTSINMISLKAFFFLFQVNMSTKKEFRLWKAFEIFT